MSTLYFRICECCDHPGHLIDDKDKYINDEKTPHGIKDLLCAITLANNRYSIKPLDDIGPDGIRLIEWCVDFLIFSRDFDDDDMDELCLRSDYEQREIHKQKYISLWSFIYDFLKIPKNGMDYLLMCALDSYDIIEHGSGIRCAWLNNDHSYHGRVLAPARFDEILQWIKNAPDNIGD